MTTNYNLIGDVLGLKNIVDEYFDTLPYQYNRVHDAPLVNLEENGDNVTITALAPGSKIEDINLELIDTTLQMTINRPRDYENAQYIRRERYFGTFSKSIRIPFRVNPEKINAVLKDGVLSVTLEKSEDAKPRKISIQ